MDGEGTQRNTPILHSPRDIPSPCAIAGVYARMHQVPHPPLILIYQHKLKNELLLLENNYSTDSKVCEFSEIFFPLDLCF